MKRTVVVMAIWTLELMILGTVVEAEDNQLTREEKQEGWQLLFNGRDWDGWMNSDGEISQWPIEDGAINPHRCGAYMMVHKKKFENFVLSLDVKISPKCNSGIFFRTFTLEKRNGRSVGFNGLEIAIDDTQTAGYVDTGALYDLSKPTKNAMKAVGEWTHIILECVGPKVLIAVNGQVVNKVDLDDFTQENLRPDGTRHKFDVVYKDHPRSGYIGLQDHGADCWYKNIKIKVLK